MGCGSNEKKGKRYKDVAAVPESWIIGSTLYWPKNNLLSLLENVNSIPTLDWEPYQCKVYETGIVSKDLAEQRVSVYQSVSDSDEAERRRKKTEYDLNCLICYYTTIA